jgi:hypothetical protein
MMTRSSSADDWNEPDDRACAPGPAGLHAVPSDRSTDEVMDLMAALQGRLATLPVIEQAKGGLMMTYGLTADAAFAALRAHSQHRNIKIRDLAAELIGTAPHHPFGARAHGDLNRLLNAVTDDFLRSAEPGAHPSTAALGGPTNPDGSDSPTGPDEDDAGPDRARRSGPAS